MLLICAMTRLRRVFSFQAARQRLVALIDDPGKIEQNCAYHPDYARTRVFSGS